MTNDLSRGTKSDGRAEAIDEARDLLIDEAFQLSPPNHWFYRERGLPPNLVI